MCVCVYLCVVCVRGKKSPRSLAMKACDKAQWLRCVRVCLCLSVCVFVCAGSRSWRGSHSAHQGAAHGVRDEAQRRECQHGGAHE
jgi:hypothetical protein